MIQSGLSESLQHNPVTAVAVLFGAGVLTSLTPCIYPMIPITAGIVGGTAGTQRSRGRIAGLTFTYVSGLALVYSLAGLLAGLSGSMFGSVAASPWARLAVASLLALFGLAMLGAVPVPVSQRAADWAGSRLAGGSVPAVFMLGATSGLVAAPCGAPAFAAVLTWVATTGSAGLGFLYLFAFSLGMTALLVVVGLSSGAAARLPRAGEWMNIIKRISGVFLLGMAGYYVFQAWQVW